MRGSLTKLSIGKATYDFPSPQNLPRSKQCQNSWRERARSTTRLLCFPERATSCYSGQRFVNARKGMEELLQRLAGGPKQLAVRLLWASSEIDPLRLRRATAGVVSMPSGRLGPSARFIAFRWPRTRQSARYEKLLFPSCHIWWSTEDACRAEPAAWVNIKGSSLHPDTFAAK